MWISKHLSLNNKGFTLIELLVSIGITSILFMNLYSMLTFSINSSAIGEAYDEMLLNGRYGIEFIKEDIERADKIISIHNISVINNKHPYNMGFVVMKQYIDEEGNMVYRYTSYYLGDERIYIITYNKEDNPSYPNKTDTPGYNIVCENVVSIEDTNIDFENNIINLKISVGSKNKVYHNFKSTIAIRCPVDY